MAMLLAMLLASLGLGLWLDSFHDVRGSTSAWLSSFIARILLVGDFRAAAATSMIPNTIYNPLYPALVAGICSVTPWEWDPVLVSHCVSAASLGLAAWALWALWNVVGGSATACLASLACLFPPLLSTAAMARYDLPALALTLLSARCAQSAMGKPGTWRWLLAGLLAGLAYNTREYMLAPALGAVLAAASVDLVMASSRMGTRLARTRPLFLLVTLCLGLGLGTMAPPVLLGLSPAAGLEAVLGYGSQSQFGSGRSLVEILYLDRLPTPLALGLLGMLAVTWRAPRRESTAVFWGMLLPFIAFLASAQQSPQYYLLGHVLVLSGIAGFLPPIPVDLTISGIRVGAIGRWALVVFSWSALAPWMLAQVPAMMVTGRANTTIFHSEGWPAWPGEPAEILSWAIEEAGEIPLVVMSGSVENVDALAQIHGERPVAFLFREWSDRLTETRRIYDGQPLLLLAVEALDRELPAFAGALHMGIRGTENLHARLFLLPGLKQQPGIEDPCLRGGVIRGACLQREWLAGGWQAVRRRVLEEDAWHRGLVTKHTLWW